MYITNHYIYFIIAAVVLIISAVGFVVEEKQIGLNKAKDVPTEDEKEKEVKEKKEGKK